MSKAQEKPKQGVPAIAIVLECASSRNIRYPEPYRSKGIYSARKKKRTVERLKKKP